jgi:hypothetical protein
MLSESNSRVRSLPTSLRFLAVAATLAFGGTVSLQAGASETFPTYLAEKYDMPCVPACTLCHLTNLGGLNMFRDPSFAVSLIVTGNTIGSPTEAGAPASMDPALAAMASMGTDADMDGLTDIAEITVGSDPNGGVEDLCQVPKYGCGASMAPTAPTRFGALGLAFSVMLVLFFRRRR